MGKILKYFCLASQLLKRGRRVATLIQQERKPHRIYPVVDQREQYRGSASWLVLHLLYLFGALLKNCQTGAEHSLFITTLGKGVHSMNTRFSGGSIKRTDWPLTVTRLSKPVSFMGDCTITRSFRADKNARNPSRSGGSPSRNSASRRNRRGKSGSWSVRTAVVVMVSPTLVLSRA